MTPYAVFIKIPGNLHDLNCDDLSDDREKLFPHVTSHNFTVKVKNKLILNHMLYFDILYV